PPAETAEAEQREQEGEPEGGRSRRRRRRRRRRDDEPVSAAARLEEVGEAREAPSEPAPGDSRAGNGSADDDKEADGRAGRRGPRGGRRRSRREGDSEFIFEEPRPPSDIVEILPVFPNEKFAPSPVASLEGSAAETGGVEAETARESRPLLPDPVVAPFEMPVEIVASPTPVQVVEARAPADA